MRWLGSRPIPLFVLEWLSPIRPRMSILLKSGYQVIFIVCDVVEWTMNHGIESCSEKCRAAVCLQSNEQFVSLQEMLLAICNAQFNASAFVGNPTIQYKEKDIRFKNLVSVCCEYCLTQFITGHFIVGWFTGFYTVSLR